MQYLSAVAIFGLTLTPILVPAVISAFHAAAGWRRVRV